MSTFYNKTEIDTTFTNYYTQTQIDTSLSTNYQTNTQLGTNYCNKTEVDGLIAGVGGGDGYTDTEIDNLLALRVPVSDFTNRFSANPIIDCSAPTVIHSGLTLNNSTVNISPVAGLAFSNQTGGGDKVLAEFKNVTSYITLQGDKIFCNNTSDDAIKQLDLTGVFRDGFGGLAEADAPFMVVKWLSNRTNVCLRYLLRIRKSARLGCFPGSQTNPADAPDAGARAGKGRRKRHREKETKREREKETKVNEEEKGERARESEERERESEREREGKKKKRE